MRDSFGHEIESAGLPGPNGHRFEPKHENVPAFKSDAELLRQAKAEASVMRETIAQLQGENSTLKESVANLSLRAPLPNAEPVPAHETVQYADGSSASGPGPLPRTSPEGAPAVEPAAPAA